MTHPRTHERHGNVPAHGRGCLPSFPPRRKPPPTIPSRLRRHEIHTSLYQGANCRSPQLGRHAPTIQGLPPLDFSFRLVAAGAFTRFPTPTPGGPGRPSCNPPTHTEPCAPRPVGRRVPGRWVYVSCLLFTSRLGANPKCAAPQGSCARALAPLSSHKEGERFGGCSHWHTDSGPQPASRPDR